MKDIALYKTILLNESVGIHLQQYVLGEKSSDLFRLDLMNFDVFEFSKFVDGDLLTLQLSSNKLDELCEAWITHRQNHQTQQDEAKTNPPQ
jgi:hypothetical protein